MFNSWVLLLRAPAFNEQPRLKSAMSILYWPQNLLFGSYIALWPERTHIFHTMNGPARCYVGQCKDGFHLICFAPPSPFVITSQNPLAPFRSHLPLCSFSFAVLCSFVSISLFLATDSFPALERSLDSPFPAVPFSWAPRKSQSLQPPRLLLPTSESFCLLTSSQIWPRFAGATSLLMSTDAKQILYFFVFQNTNTLELTIFSVIIFWEARVWS